MHSYGLLVVLKTLHIIVFIDSFIHLFLFIPFSVDVAGENGVATCFVFPRIYLFFLSSCPSKINFTVQINNIKNSFGFLRSVV